MATKAQREFAQDFMGKNPHVRKMYLNPKGEFFTDSSYAHNSLEKDKSGKPVGKVETILYKEPAKEKVEDVETTEVEETETTEEKEAEADDESSKKK